MLLFLVLFITKQIKKLFNLAYERKCLSQVKNIYSKRVEENVRIIHRGSIRFNFKMLMLMIILEIEEEINVIKARSKCQYRKTLALERLSWKFKVLFQVLNRTLLSSFVYINSLLLTIYIIFVINITFEYSSRPSQHLQYFFLFFVLSICSVITIFLFLSFYLINFTPQQISSSGFSFCYLSRDTFFSLILSRLFLYRHYLRNCVEWNLYK